MVDRQLGRTEPQCLDMVDTVGAVNLAPLDLMTKNKSTFNVVAMDI